MKQYAILGLGSFGKAILEELLGRQVELMIADKNEDAINQYKSRVTAAFVADVAYLPTLKEILPASLDGCVVDLGDNTEASILLTHYLKRQGFKNVMVLGKSPEHSEILSLLGADKVVFAAAEAAKRIVPMLINNGLISYTPLGSGLSFAEIALPEEVLGKNLREAKFRENWQLNVIAARSSEHNASMLEDPSEEKHHFDLDPKHAESNQYRTLLADYVFDKADILLVSGSEESILSFAERHAMSRKSPSKNFFVRLFKKS